MLSCAEECYKRQVVISPFNFPFASPSQHIHVPNATLVLQPSLSPSNQPLTPGLLFVLSTRRPGLYQHQSQCSTPSSPWPSLPLSSLVRRPHRPSSPPLPRPLHPPPLRALLLRVPSARSSQSVKNARLAAPLALSARNAMHPTTCSSSYAVTSTLLAPATSSALSTLARMVCAVASFRPRAAPRRPLAPSHPATRTPLHTHQQPRTALSLLQCRPPRRLYLP